MIGAHQSNPLDWNPHKPLGNLVSHRCNGEKALRTVYLYRERTSPNRCYVGQTCNEKDRRHHHNSAVCNLSRFHSRIKELRKDAGKKIPVHELFEYSKLFQKKVTQSEVDFYERALIFHFNAYPGGYSKSWKGGTSEKQRQKLSKAHQGLTKENCDHVRRMADTKRGRTKETHEGVRRQSEKVKGIPTWNKGKECPSISKGKKGKPVPKLIGNKNNIKRNRKFAVKNTLKFQF